jgi:hypothetical protein
MKAAQKPKGGSESSESEEELQGKGHQQANAVAKSSAQPKPHDGSSSDEDGEGGSTGPETRSQLLKRHQKASAMCQDRDFRGHVLLLII